MRRALLLAVLVLGGCNADPGFDARYRNHAAAIEDEAKANRASAILALVGVINLPIIKFSVDWWNTLHQPASIMRAEGMAIAPVYLAPMGLMNFGFLALFMALWLVRIRAEVYRRRARALALQAAAKA